MAVTYFVRVRSTVTVTVCEFGRFGRLFRGLGFMFLCVFIMHTEIVDSWVRFFDGKVHRYLLPDQIGRIFMYAPAHSEANPSYLQNPLLWRTSRYNPAAIDWSWTIYDLLGQTFAPNGYPGSRVLFLQLLVGVLEDPDIIV